MSSGSTWKIYYEKLDENGRVVSVGKHPTEYETDGKARLMAHKKYGDIFKFRYVVGKYIEEDTCPICREKYLVPRDGFGTRRTGHQIELIIWRGDGDARECHHRSRCVCPTCGEQLKKCMEENPQ